jgi:hypothetical protein
MTSRERHASGAASATVALPPKSHASTAAARPGSSTEIVAPVSPWETLYRHIPPAQQADLLALAARQGLLYSHQLPTAVSPRSAPADESRGWNLLGKMLAGQVAELEPLRPQSLDLADAELDDGQRRAVAAALATTDVCLIQGLPGTGKSRVVLEILAQAARRGDRVLFLAAHAAALDCVLEQAGRRDELCPLRCVAPDEALPQLPPAVRAWTLGERAATLRQQSVAAARQGREAAELQCARRRHEESLWPRLVDWLAEHDRHQAALAEAETRLAGVEAEVAGEVEANTETPVAREVRGLRQACAERLAQLDAETSAAEQRRVAEQTKLAALEQEMAAVAPLAAARQQTRWWSGTWWRAMFKGDVAARLAELEKQCAAAQEALTGLEKRLGTLAADRAAVADEAEAKCRARVGQEVAQRRERCQDAVTQLRTALHQSEQNWDDLCLQIEADALRPAGRTAEALTAARDGWQRQRTQDEARAGLLREWSDYLESSADSLAERLPGFANVIAATPAGLAADPHFSDAAASGGSFDLLVLDEAEHLTESDFLKAARRARAWVLVSEPPLPAEARGNGHAEPPGRGRSPARSAPAVGARGQYVYRLWDHLHCDPSQLPYTWFHEAGRVGCRLRQLAPEQRRALESEPLADAPDVELRILALPRARPVLAEVLFAPGMDVRRAKEFLFQELQELTVQTLGRRLRWVEAPDHWVLHFDNGGTPRTSIAEVTLDRGIREILSVAGEPRQAGLVVDTCRLEFERARGWDRAGAEAWVEQHLCLRDLGRTVALEVPHRMESALAQVVNDVLFAGGHEGSGAAPASTDGRPAVEFVAVPALGKGKPASPGRSGDSRPPRRGEAGAAGAGLELDLAMPRHADRLPSELRAGLPNRGIVNYLEARAVVHVLEEIYRPGGRHNRAAGQTPPCTAVIALFASQADLLRQLIKQAPILVAHPGAITVGTPGAFRQREADIVVLSLTRSHTHRAVAYGEGPAALHLALTRARRQLVVVGDPGNLARRSHWQGVLDHLDETAAQREGQILGQLVRYVHGKGPYQHAFRLSEGSVA